MHTRHSDERPPPDWLQSEVIAIAKIVNDLNTIAWLGDVEEFLLYLRGAMAQEFGDEIDGTDAQDSYYRGRRSEGEELARLIFPTEHRAVRAAFSFMEDHRRFRFKLIAIGKEADRLRAEQAKPKARVSA